MVLSGVGHCWDVQGTELQLCLDGPFPPQRSALYHYEALEARLCTGRWVTVPYGPFTAVHSSAKASPHSAGSKETYLGFAPILSAAVWCHKQLPKAIWASCWRSCGWAQDRVEERGIFFSRAAKYRFFPGWKTSNREQQADPGRS